MFDGAFHCDEDQGTQDVTPGKSRSPSEHQFPYHQNGDTKSYLLTSL